MSGQALAIIDAELVTPGRRPSGVTLKQWRLAQLLPRAESAYQACIDAGYKPSVALGTAKRAIESAGVLRATQALQRRRVDSVRGLAGISAAALATAEADIKGLPPEARLGVGLKFAEAAANLGESVEQVGDATAHERRRLRSLLLMAKLTEQRLSPTICSGFAARNRAARQKARGY